MIEHHEPSSIESRRGPEAAGKCLAVCARGPGPSHFELAASAAAAYPPNHMGPTVLTVTDAVLSGTYGVACVL